MCQPFLLLPSVCTLLLSYSFKTYVDDFSDAGNCTNEFKQCDLTGVWGTKEAILFR